MCVRVVGEFGRTKGFRVNWSSVHTFRSSERVCDYLGPGPYRRPRKTFDRIGSVPDLSVDLERS